MVSVKQLFSDAMHLFFPHNCLGCGSDVLPAKSLLCLHCISTLPYTGYEVMENNPVEKIFRGRTTLRAASSTFYFSKSQVIQTLIHLLKYKANLEVGEYLGELSGKMLLSSGRFSNLDYIIPLPLSEEKEFKRGFNQSEIICRGMSATMGVPVLLHNVVRHRYTDTQTKKHRAERWENVEGSFAVRNPGTLQGKNILLVDDVITTGATLEACTQCIRAAAPDLSVSMATVATASK